MDRVDALRREGIVVVKRDGEKQNTLEIRLTHFRRGSGGGGGGVRLSHWSSGDDL